MAQGEGSYKNLSAQMFPRIDCSNRAVVTALGGTWDGWRNVQAILVPTFHVSHGMGRLDLDPS